jgi:LmbE family N-acetylglucosaminyl deacetylase
VADILVITPHPDDEAYAFGGLLSIASDAGWESVLECATAGELGKRHDGGDPSPDALGRDRLAELADSCAILGVTGPPRCWGLPDGELANQPSQAERITELVAEFEPVLVLALGPDGAYGHPDHLALHRWISEAWTAMGDDAPALLHAAFPKGLFVPQWEKCLDMLGDPPHPARDRIGIDRPEIAIRIEEVARRKLAAIAAHRSQLPGGDPLAIFPPGVVAGTLREEWYTVGGGHNAAEVLSMLLPGN